MKSKLPPNNCITCGVDLNHCADKDLENNQCGFCSPKTMPKEIIENGKVYKVKSTLPLIFICSLVVTTILGALVWNGGYDNLPIWVMLFFIANLFLWHLLFGSVMAIEKNPTIAEKWD